MIRTLLSRCSMTFYPVVSYCTGASSISTRMNQTDGVRTITLANPKSRNALSLSTLNELLTHISTDVDQTDLRCIVLRAEGPVFSSGHNLKEFDLTKGSVEDNKQVFSACTQLMMHIVQCPVPVVAVVDGLAAAAGCQLVAQCDIALCTPRSTFSTPGASFGVFCSTPGIAVARNITLKVALKMLLTGLPINADEAYQCGLVSKVVNHESLDDELKRVISAIKSKSRSVISLGKKFFYQQVEVDLSSAYRMGEEVMVNNLSLKDGQEGIKSFIEKRKPNWNHNFDR